MQKLMFKVHYNNNTFEQNIVHGRLKECFFFILRFLSKLLCF